MSHTLLSTTTRSSSRFGKAYTLIVFGLLVTGALVGAGWYAWAKYGTEATEVNTMVETVERGLFLYEITAKGSVESASNDDVRCEVESKGGGVMILSIVPEGTYVEKGDIICELDKSSLEDEMIQQQIVCNGSHAEVVQAQANYDTALLAKEEYIEGTYKQEYKTIQNKIFEAQEAERTAQQELESSERLRAKGYVTEQQVLASEFALKQAEKKREIAELELKVLEDYTQKKQLKKFGSDIETAKASLESKQHSYQLDENQLRDIQQQIENCTIRAPSDGQVVYYVQNSGRYSSNETVIEEGAVVRERQILVRLPDPKQMQVKANVNEANISLVGVGMPATIRMDAMPDQVLKGEVVTVNEYPEPTSFFSGNIKEYKTTVSINNSPKGLKAGLSSEVRILVDRQEDVLMVPAQCVFEHGDKFYCIRYSEKPGDWEAVVVQVGSTNDSVIVILSGLEEGERVVHGASRYRDRVDLPELDEEMIKEGKTELYQGRSTPPGVSSSPSAPAPATPSASSGGRPNPDAMFSGLDKNSDGKLEGDEIPDMMRDRVADVDTNGDKAISKAEMTAAMSKGGGAAGGGGRPSGGAGSRSGGPGGGRPAGGGGRPPAEQQ